MSKVAKKYRRLEIKQKIQILSRLEQGESTLKLAAEYNVTHPTICRVKKKKDELNKYARLLKDSDGSENKKVMNYMENQALDNTLFTWFQQRRLLGEPISGPLLKEKAIILNQELNGPDHFKASNGWLWRFKQRHNIRELSVQEESLSSDKNTENLFLDQSIEIKEERIDPEDIYNADESGLLWKNSPTKTLTTCSEQTASEQTMIKDRVTFMSSDTQKTVVKENDSEEEEKPDLEELKNPTTKEALLALKVLSRWLETADVKCDRTQLTLDTIGAMIRDEYSLQKNNNFSRF